jgi:hypothetical protein
MCVFIMKKHTGHTMRNILGFIIAIPLMLGMFLGPALPYVFAAIGVVFGLGVLVGHLFF